MHSSILGAASMALLSGLFVRPAVAQSQTPCVYLQNSTVCPAFNQSYISTNSNLTAIFPFLATVTDSASFDSELLRYVHGDFVQSKFVNIFGCSNVNLQNTTQYYAQYTISFICNAIVQISQSPCSVPAGTQQPLCASDCGDFAMSEQRIVSSPELCGTPGPNAMKELRADYTNCGIPDNSISTNCIHAYENEPANCGYQNNLAGFCAFCNSTSTVNSTDSCCVTGNAESLCPNVQLPTYGNMQPLFPTGTSSSAPAATGSSAAATSSNSSGLSGGAIAGIVVGSVVGAALLLGIIIGCCLFMRRRRDRSPDHSVKHFSPPQSASGKGGSQQGGSFTPLPGSRVTRMTALDSSPGHATPPRGASYGGANLGAGAGAADGAAGLAAAAPVVAGAAGISSPKKSSSEYSRENEEASPEYSSPEGVPGQSSSERMSSFKDYYSSDEIHPHDAVSVLWAYEPRAGDEFELERGDMIRIVGIWDDGWATGVRLNSRAEDWEPARDTQRDSGFSTRGDTSPPTSGEVKAFPLVCVCLPQHWKKTVEGEEGQPGSSHGPPEADE